MKYKDSSTGFEIIQNVKDGGVYSDTGFITDDAQVIGSAASTSIDIYENNGANNFAVSYSLDHAFSNKTRHLRVTSDYTFMIASFQAKNEIRVYTRGSGTITFSHNQTITLQTSESWRPSITNDHLQIVVGDKISSIYYVQIYTYNPISEQFDAPTDPTLIQMPASIRLASLSEDKKYLAVSTSSGIFLYTSPLSSSPVLEQTLSSSQSKYHRFSKDGKYLIHSANDKIEITINC